MYELSVGSKVFLFGEYQVLNGGAALVINLEPRFKLQVKTGTGLVAGISKESPAGRYLQQEQTFFNQFDLKFIDPHLGRGGFGASTAQLALLMGLRDGFSWFQSEAEVDFDIRKFHKKYLELATTETGVAPSGADLIGQIRGGLVEVDIGGGKIQWQAWPFPQWDLLFFATGYKQATHEHLSQLKELNISSLRTIYHATLEAFKNREAELFVKGLGDYQKELAHQGWQTSFTAGLLQKILPMTGVMAAKGCGAMGADVVAVLVEKKEAATLKTKITELGVTFIGDLDQRTDGFAYVALKEGVSEQALLGASPCL